MALLLTVVRVPTGRDTGEQYRASCTPLPAAARGTLQACLNTAKSFVDQWPAPVKDAGAQVGEVQDFGDGAPGFHFILKQVAFCGPAGVGALRPCKGLSWAVESAEIAFSDGYTSEVGGAKHTPIVAVSVRLHLLHPADVFASFEFGNRFAVFVQIPRT